MTTELRHAWTRYLATSRKNDEAQTVLHQAIRDAHAGGMSMRAIASEVGLSFQRVAQILNADQ